jgi:molybdopterin synthase sulfur carrier subunit
MRVLLFGPLQDAAGWRERSLTSPPGRLSDLVALLTEEDPTLGSALIAKGVRAAVDKILVHGDPTLGPGSEVAFLPPMSGG